MEIYDRIEAIEAKMKEIIEAGVYDVTLKSVILGNKERSSDFKPPLIQIVGNESDIDSITMGIAEEWALKYVVVAVIESYEHEDGKKIAEKLVLQATSELFKDRSNRTLGGLCRTIRRSRWTPTRISQITGNKETLFGVGVEMTIEFNNKEVC
jgi:hypothetical protein